MKDRKQILFLLLAGVFISNALLAELVGVKIFSLEKTFGLLPLDWTLFGLESLDMNLTAGVILWPVVFITTDLINEYFGKSGVKLISFLTAGLIAYAFIILLFVNRLAPADFWLQVNGLDSSGKTFDINYAFNTIFSQGMGIIVASLFAFLVGQLLDVYVFHRLRMLSGSRWIWLRATGSTLVSQFIDSFLVLGIAFYLLGNWSIQMVLAVGLINYLYKFTVALLLTPLLYLVHTRIEAYLGKQAAEELSEQASKESKGFF